MLLSISAISLPSTVSEGSWSASLLPVAIGYDDEGLQENKINKKILVLDGTGLSFPEQAVIMSYSTLYKEAEFSSS